MRLQEFLAKATARDLAKKNRSCHKFLIYPLVAICFSVLSGCVNPGDPMLEARFLREQPTLSVFEGTTSESSCSGTGLTVYLKGTQVRQLDWRIEKSTRLIRRQYYFEGPAPCLVVETIQAKLDAHAKPLAQPRLLSTKRYLLDVAKPTKYQKELIEHAKFLMNDFQRNRIDFSRVNMPDPSTLIIP